MARQTSDSRRVTAGRNSSTGAAVLDRPETVAHKAHADEDRLLEEMLRLVEASRAGRLISRGPRFLLVLVADDPVLPVTHHHQPPCPAPPDPCHHQSCEAFPRAHEGVEAGELPGGHAAISAIAASIWPPTYSV